MHLGTHTYTHIHTQAICKKPHKLIITGDGGGGSGRQEDGNGQMALSSSAPSSRGQDAPCGSGVFAPDLTSPMFLFMLDSSAKSHDYSK